MASRYLIVASKFNDLISKSLVAGAMETFSEAHVPEAQLDTLWVPGAFELPVVAAKAARSGSYAAIICLGAVIRGETPHFDYVAGQAAAGLMKVGLDTGVPVIFGVITTDTVEQALNRSGIKSGNKGCDAARAALAMTGVMAKLDALTQER